MDLCESVSQCFVFAAIYVLCKLNGSSFGKKDYLLIHKNITDYIQYTRYKFSPYINLCCFTLPDVIKENVIPFHEALVNYFSSIITIFKFSV